MINTNYLQSKEQTAVQLNVSIQTLNRIISRGELQPVYIGRAVKFKPEDINAYLNRTTKQSLQSA